MSHCRRAHGALLLRPRWTTPDKGFKWTWHLFWGFTEMEKVYWDTWNGTATNKKVAIMFPNDVDGNAYREYFTPEKCAENGFTTVDPGPFQPMTDDFTTQISLFKKEGCEILSAVFLPPEMATFWTQSLQQGFNPLSSRPSRPRCSPPPSRP